MGAIYATAADLALRWPPFSSLPSQEQARAEVLLGDAAVRIRSACPEIDAKLAADPQEIDPEIPLIVSCEMVKRAMLTPVDQAAVKQAQETSGPFSRSLTYSNPTGDLYLTKEERRLLGCSFQRAGSHFMASAPDVFPIVAGDPTWWCEP